MLKRLIKLIIKFVLTFAAALFTFGFIGLNPIFWIAVVALAGTILNFVIGDLILLQKFSKIVAALFNGILALIAAFVIDLLTLGFCTNLITLPFFAVTVAIVEFFFHRYILKKHNQ